MMKHLRCITIGVIIFLCLCLIAPLHAQAASASKSNPNRHKSLAVKQKKAVSQSASKNRQDRKLAASKKNKKQARAKSGKSVAKKSAKNTDNFKDRDIWLKRAAESEVLTGKASWYGRDFHNKATASGLNYDMHTFTAAHRTLPMGTVVKVTDQTNGRSVMVCVTDRGPYTRDRIIDVSYAAAKKLDLDDRGVGKVNLEVVSDEKGAPLNADQAFFVRYASENGKNRVGPFHAFADAAAMHEALRQAHPEAEVVVEKSGKH